MNVFCAKKKKEIKIFHSECVASVVVIVVFVAALIKINSRHNAGAAVAVSGAVGVGAVSCGRRTKKCFFWVPFFVFFFFFNLVGGIFVKFFYLFYLFCHSGLWLWLLLFVCFFNGTGTWQLIEKLYFLAIFI